MSNFKETTADPIPFRFFYEQSRVYFRVMSPTRILSSILAILLAYNATFFALHLSGRARIWKDALNDLQSTLSILELMAVVALFVDLVVRYDNIPNAWQTPRVIAVGLCVAGLLFKWFILYLHLSYLVD